MNETDKEDGEYLEVNTPTFDEEIKRCREQIINVLSKEIPVRFLIGDNK